VLHCEHHADRIALIDPPFSTASDIGEPARPVALPSVRGALSLAHVSFTYEGAGKPAIADLSVEVFEEQMRILLNIAADLFPQETSMELAATSSNMATADCFNPGTPKNMRNGELDARIGIIAEGFCRGFPGEHRS
jgi:hypothetical protein